MKRLVLIDSYAIIHRAFHALPPLTSPAGEPVGAVFGFASMLLKLLRELKPDYVAAAFDSAGPTFRHIAYERYKATRQKAPDALYQQIPLVKELVAAFGIPVIEKQGYEADDIIGTIAFQVSRNHPGVEVIIATGDLDTLQLIDKRVRVYTMRKGVSDTVLYDDAAVKERYGLPPKRLVDFKGLRGDPSDNIPGVKGIGEKTASELLTHHGTVEGVYKALKKGRLNARPGVIAALKAHEADALFSKTLATIDKNAPVSFVLESSRLRKAGAVGESSRALLSRLGFESLLKRMGVSYAAPGPVSDVEHRTPPEIKRVAGLWRVLRHGPAVILSDPERDKLFVAVSDGKAYEVPLSGISSLASREWLAAHKTYFFDSKPLIRSGLRFDTAVMVDLALVWQLLEPGRRSYEVESLIARETTGGTGAEEWGAIACRLLEIASGLEKKLEQHELLGVYNDIEAPLPPILATMEERGIGFNANSFKPLSAMISAELAKLEAGIYAAAGSPFNILSPRQLGDVLFNRLGFAGRGIRRTEKTGAYSTSEAELMKIKGLHPVVGDILSFREFSKLKSTYVDALPKMAGPDGRIHTTWNQMGAATGRITSSGPNLQNIPARSVHGRDIRRAFVAAKGFRLAAFDYSQLELRIAADLAADAKMKEAFRRGIDIHRLTASEVSNVPVEKITPDLRYRAKALNFGVLYGMGARSFAESAGITRGEAEHFIEEYFNDFKGIARFMEKTKAEARELGFVKTAFGRKRFFPDIASSNFRLAREAERMAVNHPIQGTAADIVKKAMIAVSDFIRGRGLANDVRLLLQIHDELIFEISAGAAEDVLPEIKDLMERVWTGEVKMRVEVSHGANWGDLK